MGELGKHEYCSEQARSENPLGIEVLATMLFGLLLLASMILSAAADDGFTLQVFGNANMDDRIDDSDLNYAWGIISGSNRPTELADANYDGKIDEADVDQIKKMIAGTAERLTIRDAQNRNVTLNLPIKRAVGANTGAIEIARGIGVDIGEVFAAVTTYAITNPEYYPELKGKVENKFGSPDYETLAILKPDLVILYNKPVKDESFDKFEAIGAPVICLDCFNKESLDGSVKILGEIFDRRDKAQELLDWYHGYIDLIRYRTVNLKSRERPKTLFYSNPDYYYPIVKARNRNSGDHWLIVDAGGENLGENLNSTTGSAEVEREWVASQNPDIIIGSINQAVNKSGYSADEDLAVSYMRTMHEKIVSDEAISKTDAAAMEKVYLICSDLNTGPMQAAGTAFMAKIIHPELFEDLDPEDILEEYLEKWQGIPYKGVWIYPPIVCSNQTALGLMP
ncbi:MAG: Vitamin B12-binding protein [Methanosaeta sp. PtaB.Bin039]|nr:MAG: Vitamin B12-binding protein [Methanosaeta sp. PtaB.Bin039]